MQLITLEDAEQRIDVWPEAGANIVSWVYKPLNWELAFQLEPSCYRLPDLERGFAGCNAAGLDDMFFTTDACTWQGPEPGSPILELPDHGDWWFRPIRCTTGSTPESHPTLHCSANVSNEAGFRYRLTKQVVLRPGARLEFYYEVLNEAQSSVLPFYVAWHPLFALQCPAAVSWNPSYSLVLTQPWFDHRNQQLWPIGSRFSYRTLQQLHGLSYDPMQPTDPPDTLKGFIEGPPHATGLHLTYSLPHTNRRLRLTFTPPPESRMPMQSVGLWFNRGGFRNEANVALEPCTFWGDTPNAQPGSSLTLPLVYPMHTGYTRFICQLTVL